MSISKTIEEVKTYYPKQPYLTVVQTAVEYELWKSICVRDDLTFNDYLQHIKGGKKKIIPKEIVEKAKRFLKP